MLRRVENVSVHHRAGWLTKKGPVTVRIGRRSWTAFARMHRNEYGELLQRCASFPVCVIRVDERAYWLFQDRWHWDNEGLNGDQVYALLVTREQRRLATISRAQTMVAMQQQPAPSVRGAIPSDVKQLIWSRDGGRCRACGSNTELQFDHIIPIAYGGGSDVENLQVLCGPCNRRKGASVQ